MISARLAKNFTSTMGNFFTTKEPMENGGSITLRSRGDFVSLGNQETSCAICYGLFFIVSDALSSFQPPNAWHEVFTPTKSVTIGGHYFTYDTLHLTDAARFFDIHRPGATNQHHTSAQLTLSAMAVNMIRRGPNSTSFPVNHLSLWSYFIRSLPSQTPGVVVSDATLRRLVPFEG